MSPEEALALLTRVRQYTQDGKRYPHKPLSLLLVLARLGASGSSATPWSEAEGTLADLIAAFGPTSKTGRAQSAAYPFTRLRSDGIWQLDADVPMDNVGPLRDADVVGTFPPELEAALTNNPGLIELAARSLAEAEFPPTLVPDVLLATGFDPDAVLGEARPAQAAARVRSRTWVRDVLLAWDRQCAFCGYDGQLGNTQVGLEAAHVRWFSHGGPDELDNGLALCALHHKLLDRGALGLTTDGRIRVSTNFTARTSAGRSVYELNDRELRPRPGTPIPAISHVEWHGREVFQSVPG